MFVFHVQLVHKWLALKGRAARSLNTCNLGIGSVFACVSKQAPNAKEKGASSHDRNHKVLTSMEELCEV